MSASHVMVHGMHILSSDACCQPSCSYSTAACVPAHCVPAMVRSCKCCPAHTVTRPCSAAESTHAALGPTPAERPGGHMLQHTCCRQVHDQAWPQHSALLGVCSPAENAPIASGPTSARCPGGRTQTLLARHRRDQSSAVQGCWRGQATPLKAHAGVEAALLHDAPKGVRVLGAQHLLLGVQLLEPVLQPR